MTAPCYTPETGVIEISEQVNALYIPETGSLSFRLFGLGSDLILATSSWLASKNLTDNQVRAFYREREDSVWVDFDERIRSKYAE